MEGCSVRIFRSRGLSLIVKSWILAVLTLGILMSEGVAAPNGLSRFKSALFAAKLNQADVEFIVKDLNLGSSKDGREIIDLGGCGILEFDVNPVDLKTAGKAGLSVTVGNTCTSGPAGFSTYFYIKNGDELIHREFGFPAASINPIYRNNSSLPDIRVEGPGFCHPVYRWKTQNYLYLCSEADTKGACDGVASATICNN